MALNVGQLYVNIGANINGLTNGLKQASQQIKDFGNRMTSLGTKLTATISLPLTMVGKNAIQMAMDVVESEALFEQSMKGMSDSAREWSESLKEAYGLNAYELRKNVGMLNTMFNSMRVGEDIAYELSTSLIKLSYDMSSFYNEDPEDMLAKIRSGMTGQSMPLMALGINMQEDTIKDTAVRRGIIKVGEEMNAQQKVIARYITLLEASADAQGNLARELDNPASQIRILKGRIAELATEFGAIFLPVVSKAINIAHGLADKWKNLSEAKKKLIAQFGLLAVAIPPIITGIGLISIAIGAIINPIGLVISAISLLVGSFIWAETKNLSATQSIADAWKNSFTRIKSTFDWFKSLIKIGMEGIYQTMLIPLAVMELAYNKVQFWKDESKKAWDFTDELINSNKREKNAVDNLVESNKYINNPELKEYENLGSKWTNMHMDKIKKEAKDDLETQTKKDYSSAINNILENFKSLESDLKIGDKVDTEAQKVASAIDSITSAIVSLQDSMKSQIGIFERFKYKATSTWKLLRNAELRDKAYREREQILNSLSQRGLSQDILAQLMQTDITELGNLKGLNKMTDEQLMKWAGYTTNADRTAERMANMTIGKVEIVIAGQEKNAKELAKEIYRELKLMGVYA
ncbi:hypothetical protein SAMN05661008_00327 [Alkalithermobacter thermoalcaliphilus JW-YL-7 = DSM 7308]|uniref:Phage tail tape measure protein, TP901 family n=2 Tax=Clostridium paradoxum TaxID=29346 RepID=A0A150FPG2_CLOPD|nr:hypothetical protein JWYL7_0562 [[Clostridium] paradoxum JW-YL-7 = DSM 7308]SHK49878.1 hypothetical protein SAMN05661008_00327 [[Clostridium] paradoxum JW-YL-7 = DSM 7308]